MRPVQALTVHVAGPLVDSIQRCSRCGSVLSDYRYATVPTDDPMPTGWAEGAHIDVSAGNPRYSSTTDDAPTCQEVR